MHWWWRWQVLVSRWFVWKRSFNCWSKLQILNAVNSWSTCHMLNLDWRRIINWPRGLPAVWASLDMFHLILSQFKRFFSCRSLTVCLPDYLSISLFVPLPACLSVSIALKCLSSYPQLLLNIFLPADLLSCPFLPPFLFLSLQQHYLPKRVSLPLILDLSRFCHCEFCFSSITLFPSSLSSCSLSPLTPSK